MRSAPWTVLLSVLAIMLSVVALGYTIHSTERARECEFLYATYDRLNELARHIDGESSRNTQIMSEFDRENNDGEVKVTDHILEDIVANVEKAERELELHRVIFDPEQLVEIAVLADDAAAKLDVWNEGRLDSLYDGINKAMAIMHSALKFWLQVIILVEVAMDTTAESIRTQCR